MIYTPDFWYSFDRLPDGVRLIWFIAYIAIPTSFALSNTKYSWIGMIFMIGVIASRMYAIKVNRGRK